MKLTLSICSLCLAALVARAQAPASRTDAIVDSAVATLFKVNPNTAGLIVGISEKGRRWYYGYGHLHSGDDRKPDSNSIFEIGSITKTFTSLLLAQALVAHKASLDEPAQKYLPPGLQLEKEGKTISLLELSNHSSGLPRMMGNFAKAPGYDYSNPYKTYSKDLLLDFLRNTAPKAVPGSHYEYSNLGAATLGLALETIWQKPYAQLLSERILAPLKMQRTYLVPPAGADDNIADGHSPDGKPTSHWDFDVVAPAGAIRSSAHDLLNYLEAQIAQKDSAIRLSHQPTLTVNNNLKVALAWHITDVAGKGSPIIWHNGGTGGFSSFAGFDPGNGTAVVILINTGALGAADQVAKSILTQLSHP